MPHLCMKGNSCVSAVTFGLGSWSAAFTRWEAYRTRANNKHPVVWKCSAYRTYRRWQRFCCMLMCDNLLFPKMPQVRTMHAWLRSDMLHYVVLLHGKIFSASMTIFSKLLSISVDSSVTNLVLAICHAWSVCCDLVKS